VTAPQSGAEFGLCWSGFLMVKLEMVKEGSETSPKENGKRFEKYVFPVLLMLIAGLLGVLLDRFFLSVSPELSYSINESSPINVDSKQYFPTSFNIVNSGNTPLENVVMSASFGGKIVSIRSEPRFSKAGELLPVCDPQTLSNTFDLTFDLAEGESHAVMIVAEGAFLKDRFFLKSNQVMGKLAEIGRKPEEMRYLIGFIIALLFAISIFVQSVIIIRKISKSRESEIERLAKERNRLQDIITRLIRRKEMEK
jgi:hypothetical protein